VTGYIIFKTIYSYVLSVLATFLDFGHQVVAAEAYSSLRLDDVGFDNLTYGHIISFSLVASLLVPAIGALIASIAKKQDRRLAS
jgi:hypothetical protein